MDECHRGSADEDSAWREILTYFSSAAQIGLTATPKQTKDISNSEYFGDLHDTVLTVGLFNLMNRLLEGHGVKGQEPPAGTAVLHWRATGTRRCWPWLPEP